VFIVLLVVEKVTTTMPFAPIPAEDERIAHEVIGAAIDVHKFQGPDFLEIIYERALLHELTHRSIPVQSQKGYSGPVQGDIHLWSANRSIGR
jgi:hypothetical protein